MQGRVKRKIVRRKASVFPLAGAIDPLIQRLYQARGVTSHVELARNLEHLLPCEQLLGIEQAVLCLATALQQQQRILVIGDFDADGATSCAVAIRGLKALGAKYVDFLVPNRFEYGYGLTPEIVCVAAARKPDLLLTVDNGISSCQGVQMAKSLGMKVVITDHHLAGAELPMADAIVNPNQPGDHFPSKHLAGVGVVFYVLLALRRYLRATTWFNEQPEPNLATLLDLVALGTVADLVPLDHNNRILIHQGIQRIRAGKCCVGILALLAVAGRSPERLVANDLGYSVGPRLNAAGRLDDMSLGIHCLLTDDLQQAQVMAQRLDELNKERRIIEADMQQQALQAINNLHLNTQKVLPLGMCLFNETWHQGVIGILAARIKEYCHRPVIAFAAANEQEIKGSARSVQGIHIRDVLESIATQNPGLITRFGGHAMAAGLTLARSSLAEFTTAFDRAIRDRVCEEDLSGVIYSDGALQKNQLNLPMAECIREAGPWGQAFPEPLFDGVFTILAQRLVGGKHLKLSLSYEQQVVDGIAFNVDLQAWPNQRAQTVQLAYRLDVNEYQGRKNLQLIVEHLEAISGNGES